MEVIKKPLFWIILLFCIRLIGINNPPLEGGHSWRQITGLMVARNFLEVDANPLYPRVDLEGGENQIVGMEFPLLNYGHFLLAKLFGYTHWYGRLINLLIFSIGVYCFSRLMEKLFDRKVALYATLAILFSIFFSYSRKMMPDTFSIAWCLMALYAAHEYIKEGKRFSIWLFGLAALAGLLSKITAGLILSPLILYYLDQHIPLKRKLTLGVTFLIVCLPVAYWYFIWNPHLAETYGSWYNQGMGLKEGWQEIRSNWKTAAEHLYFHAFYSFIGFVLLIWGLIIGLKKRNNGLLRILLVYSVFGILYILRSGFYFHHHNYYIIPFVPLFALIVAYGLSQIKPNWVGWGLISILAIESVANQQHDFFVREEVAYKMQVEPLMNEFSDQNDKIVILGSGNPQLLYLSHRKGWLRSKDQLINEAEVSRLRKEGAKYLLIDLQAEESIDWDNEIAKRGKHFLVYRF